MSRKNLVTLENQEDSDDRNSNSKKPKQLYKVTSQKKIRLNRPSDSQRHSSYESSSILTSLARLHEHLDLNKSPGKSEQATKETLPQFTQKYLPKGSSADKIYQQMQMISSFKQKQIQSLRVYRDELKFICYNNQYSSPLKVSIKLLQDKAELESKMKQQKTQIEQELKRIEKENKNVRDYNQMIFEQTQQIYHNNEILDINKQIEMMIENTKTEIKHLIRQLDQQKRKNNKEIRTIQDQILKLRIEIKQKQDNIREVKAKVCTLYIKMHSRNSSRGRSKDRNMSMSVRKFNTAKNQTIRQVFVGNSQFKNYSKQIIEKVESGQELVKIKFFIGKQKLSFQCMYQKKQGIVHTSQFNYSNRAENPRSINSKTDEIIIQQVFTKYLMSIKFFYRSRIVGVECRVKTEKGNKHIQIGSCEPYIEHELITLVNRKLVTLGSYWHAKEMIGISIWFMDANSPQKIESSKKVEPKGRNINSFEQYFT